MYLCVICHENDADLVHFRFGQRKADLQSSVHGRDAKHPLDCHTCHDPHLFRPVNDSDGALTRIAASNGICLTCHGSNRPDTGGPELTDVSRIHELIPNYANHLRKVKCVACHSAGTSETHHEILPKEDALRDCARCHTPESQILQAVYNPRGSSPEDLAQSAYVIGSTRSPMLERLSQIGFAITLLAITGHGLARIVYAWRKRGSGDT